MLTFVLYYSHSFFIGRRLPSVLVSGDSQTSQANIQRGVDKKHFVLARLRFTVPGAYTPKNL